MASRTDVRDEMIALLGAAIPDDYEVEVNDDGIPVVTEEEDED